MEGDITWVAPITYDDLTRLLDNPSADRVASVIKRAERGVWPLISQIDTRCLIEFALDDCIRQVGFAVACWRYRVLLLASRVNARVGLRSCYRYECGLGRLGKEPGPPPRCGGCRTEPNAREHPPLPQPDQQSLS
jgi:hypothetical protein